MSVCSYANRAGLCWPGYDNLAKTHGVTRQAVGRQIKKLIAYGYLQKVKNHSWGRTAQILRVIYDESMSDKQLLESIPFEEKPPGHQWKVLRDAESQFNNQANTVQSDKVAITAKEDTEERLSADDVVSLWKSACNQANIVRIITTEDRTAAASLVACAVSKASFERVLAEVFAAWREYRREPPHRLAWFVQRLRQEATSCPSPIAPIDVGT